MEDVRVISAYEGRLLARRRLWCRRGGEASRCLNEFLVEAGGYTELNKQISQIEDCVANGARSVIGAISADGLNNLIKELAAKKIPVIDVINGINSPDISAKSLVSFYSFPTRTRIVVEQFSRRHRRA